MGGHLCLSRGQQHHAAHFSQFERRANIECREYRFHGHGVGGVLLHKIGNQAMDFAQTRGMGRTAGKLERSESNQMRARSLKFHNAVPGGSGQCRVHAKDAPGAQR